MTALDLEAARAREAITELRVWAENGDFVDTEDPSLLIRSAEHIESLLSSLAQARAALARIAAKECMMLSETNDVECRVRLSGDHPDLWCAPCIAAAALSSAEAERG